MPTEIEVAPLRAEEYDEVLPLIAAYQRFYEVEEIDEERNREFFSRFLAPSDDGLLLGARAEDGSLVGYACLYWHFDSLEAHEVVLMNDLYVDEAARGRGVGRALIEATAAVARERGAYSVEWETAPDNHTAQRLYNTTPATRSEWIAYELPV